MDNFKKYLNSLIKDLKKYRVDSICNDRPDIARIWENKILLIKEVKKEYKKQIEKY